MEAAFTTASQDARSDHEYSHGSELRHRASMDLTDNIARLPDDTRATTGTRAPENYSHTFRKSVKSFWKRQIRATVEHEACRDHFANERTFLGYLRTSLALSVTGVIIAQLFTLQHVEVPNKTFGFHIIGVPLACICIVAAIVVLLLGSYRFWRQQNAMLRGKVHAGGWEVNAIGLTVFMMVLMLFVLIVAVEVEKDVEQDS